MANRLLLLANAVGTGRPLLGAGLHWALPRLGVYVTAALVATVAFYVWAAVYTFIWPRVTAEIMRIQPPTANTSMPTLVPVRPTPRRAWPSDRAKRYTSEWEKSRVPSIGLPSRPGADLIGTEIFDNGGVLIGPINKILYDGDRPVAALVLIEEGMIRIAIPLTNIDWRRITTGISPISTIRGVVQYRASTIRKLFSE